MGLGHGPDGGPVRAALAADVADLADAGVGDEQAREEIAAYAESSFAIGRAIRRSAIYAALHRPGVDLVDLTEPAEDVLPGATATARCLTVHVTGTVQR